MAKLGGAHAARININREGPPTAFLGSTNFAGLGAAPGRGMGPALAPPLAPPTPPGRLLLTHFQHDMCSRSLLQF